MTHLGGINIFNYFLAGEEVSLILLLRAESARKVLTMLGFEVGFNINHSCPQLKQCLFFFC